MAVAAVSGIEGSLDNILRVVARSLRQQNPDLALRLVDRAMRTFPEDRVTIGPWWGEVLARQGEHAEALKVFVRTAELRTTPTLEAHIVQINLLLAHLWSANERIEKALQRFCLTRKSAIEIAASAVLEREDCGAFGYVGIDEAWRLHGRLAAPARKFNVEIRTEDNTLLAGDWQRGQVDGAFCFTPAADQSIQPCRLRITANGRPLLGSGLVYPPPPELDGRAFFDKDRVVGWCRSGWRPDSAPSLSVRDERGAAMRLRTHHSPFKGERRFAFNSAISGLCGNRLTLVARLPDKSLAPFPDAPLLRVKRWRYPPVTAARRRRPHPRAVDIIVPVYRGLDETSNCINSILCELPDWGRLIIIDDACPEPALADLLQQSATDPRVVLLCNRENLGFPASVNRGLATSLEAGHDAVILNSDTVVFRDWLARLRSAAYSAADIGTVTPFTNKGTIASYPASGKHDGGDEVASELDRLAAKDNAGLVVDLPVGIGFCMYVRHDCLTQVGFFDAEIFQKGYGEETDFCLRAKGYRWRNVLAADVYVRHAEGRSFGPQRAALLDRSIHLIARRHPRYQGMLEKFAAHDPLRALRRAFDMRRLAAAAHTYVLLVSPALSGGIDRFFAEHCHALREKKLKPLILMPSARPGGWRLWTDDRSLEELDYEGVNDLEVFEQLIKTLRIEHIEIHHLIGLDPRLIEMLIKSRLSYDIYIHDYIWICPRIRLMDGSERYCGEPEVSECERCVRRNGSELAERISVKLLRQRSRRWMAEARTIIAPSSDTAERMLRYFPEALVKVRAWEPSTEAKSPPARRAGPTIRVALIGAIGTPKGYDVLLACARDAAQRRLPLEFVVIGYSADDATLIRTGKVFVTGRYWEQEVEGLLRRERPQLIFFPCVWPETWCYSLTHAIRSGLPIAAFDIGAVAERLREANIGMLLPLDQSASAINDNFVNMAGKRSPSARSGSRLRPTTEPDTSLMPSASKDAVVATQDSLLGATVHSVSLPKGLYYFAVAPGTRTQLSPGRLPLPAVHISVAPGTGPEQIEWMSNMQGMSNWFFEEGNAMVARVNSPTVTLVITSVRGASDAELKLNIERLDSRAAVDNVPHQVSAAVVSSEPVPVSKLLSDGMDVRLKVLSHIRGKGDLTFVDVPWAGRIGRGMWLEAFSLEPLDDLGSQDIEYKGLTASGFETPWLSNAAMCGTRGMGVPLVGFAVRMKAGPRSSEFDCEYSGYFASGMIAGPSRNGVPCRSTTPNDPLEGVQIRVKRRQLGSPKSSETENTAKTEAGKPGPRFSKFRSAVAEVEAAPISTTEAKAEVIPTRKKRSPKTVAEKGSGSNTEAAVKNSTAKIKDADLVSAIKRKALKKAAR